MLSVCVLSVRLVCVRVYLCVFLFARTGVSKSYAFASPFAPCLIVYWVNLKIGLRIPFCFTAPTYWPEIRYLEMT